MYIVYVPILCISGYTNCMNVCVRITRDSLTGSHLNPQRPLLTTVDITSIQSVSCHRVTQPPDAHYHNLTLSLSLYM